MNPLQQLPAMLPKARGRSASQPEPPVSGQLARERKPRSSGRSVRKPEADLSGRSARKPEPHSSGRSDREPELRCNGCSIRVRVADTFLSRLVGLLRSKRDAVPLSLLLTDCNAVHSLGMRRELDLVFLDDRGEVLRVARLKRWRIAYCRQASQVWEHAAGEASRAGIRVGQRWVATRRNDRAGSVRRDRPLRVTRLRGSSMVELLITAPILLLFGLGIVQTGLVYHAQTIVDHATFEAARIGAVEHALPAPMRRELGRRLAPQEGGDGTVASALRAVALSQARVADEATTRLTLLNPTRLAFDDWALPDEEAQGLAIPNTHLQHRDPQARGERSGQNLQEANLLEIEVVHGYAPSVPLANRLFVQALSLVDRENSGFYERGLMPLKATTRVRMQSEVWEQSLTAAAPVDTSEGNSTGEVSIPPGTVDIDDCFGNHGLGAMTQLMNEAELLVVECLEPSENGSGDPSASIPPPTDSAGCPG